MAHKRAVTIKWKKDVFPEELFLDLDICTIFIGNSQVKKTAMK